jgi:CRP/FNR family transcriptional regulator, cyclic AMP receptor protein
LTRATTKDNTSDKGGVKQCAPGTVLFREGEEGNRMYVIKSGQVRLSKKIHDTEVIIEELGAGEFCGELSMLGGFPRPVTAVVSAEATIIPVDAGQFEAMIKGNTDIALRMLKKMTQRLTEAQYRVTNLMLRKNKARVLHQLRHEALRHGDTGMGAPIPDNLADVLALEIGELKAILGDLIRDELIALDKHGNFQIVDSEALDRYLRYLELQDRFEYA